MFLSIPGHTHNNPPPPAHQSISRTIQHTHATYPSIYPLDTQDFDSLELAVNKLTLNDASVSVQASLSAFSFLPVRVCFLDGCGWVRFFCLFSYFFGGVCGWVRFSLY